MSLPVEGLDLNYVRSLGEEVRARLFPNPRLDGRVQYPLPVRVDYEPLDGIQMVVLFVLERIVQAVPISSASSDPSSTSVWVYASPLSLPVVVDLKFGQEFAWTSPALCEEEEVYADCLEALLRAVTGT